MKPDREDSFHPLTRFVNFLSSQELQTRFAQRVQAPTQADIPLVFDVHFLRLLFQSLPPREVDMFILYVLHQKDQKDIGLIFNVTQGDVSYRIRRFRERTIAFRILSSLSERDVLDVLRAVIKDRRVIMTMLFLLRTSSQSLSAKAFNTSQGNIRHRFFRGLRLLQRSKMDRAAAVCSLFEYLAKNFNSLKPIVPLSRWREKFA